VGGYPYPGNPFILKTTDGGESWDQTVINSLPQSIHFTNNSIGFCAAYDGIYKTTDSGNSWNLNYQDNVHFTSVQFIGENNGWVVANEFSQNLYLFRTDDGGLNWNKSLVTSDESDPKIEMVNELLGFIISKYSSKIYKTTDGGDNWIVVYDDYTSFHSFWDISFSNELNGFAGGAGVDFLSTSNGGNTWNKNSIPLLFCSNIQASENHCWVSGFGVGYNAIVYSDDYGNTWTPIFVGDSSDIQDIFFSDLNNGWYCSSAGIALPLYNGFIYKTESGWIGNILSPSTPQQIYPLDDSNFEQTTINFEWENLDYCLIRFQVSTDSLFNSFYVMVNPATGDTTFWGNNLYIENNKTAAFPLNQKYYWRVRSENKMGVSDWSETWTFNTFSPNDVNDAAIPNEFKLEQNYPNPFNPSTKISWQSPVGSWQTLKVYDILGNEVATLVNEYRQAGSYNVEFTMNNLQLSSGIYFYRL